MKKTALLACSIVCITHSWVFAQAPAAPSPVGPPPVSGTVAAPAPSAKAAPAAAPAASSPPQQWESQVVTGYRAQYTTRVETVQQEMIQPVVKYVLEKPFFGGTPRWVARTYYEQKTMTVAIPRTYQQMVPQTQVVRRPISSPNSPQFATAPTQTAARPATPNSNAPPQSMFANSPQPAQGTSLGPAYGHVPMTANQPQYLTPQAPASSPLLWSAPAHQGAATPPSGTGAYYSAENLAPYGRADLTGFGSVSALDGDPPRYGVQTPQYGSVVR